MAVDESAKDIIGIEVTMADWHDSEVFPYLLAKVDGEVAQVSADGAYDTEGTHAAIAEREARTTIPPREGAVLWGNDHPRDAILAEIEAKGRAGWKEASGYHRRSIAENMMYRLKQLGIDSSPVRLTGRLPRVTSGQPSSTNSPTSACRTPSGLGKLRPRCESGWG